MFGLGGQGGCEQELKFLRTFKKRLGGGRGRVGGGGGRVGGVRVGGWGVRVDVH